MIGTGTNYVTPVLTQGTYTYYAENMNCVNSATRTVVIVTVNALPSLSVSSNGSVCLGSTLTINVSGANTYSWSAGGNSTSIVVSPTAATIYSVSGTNSLTGCVGTNTVNITVSALPTLSATSSGSICSGSTATLNVTGADNYSWSPGGNSSSITVSPSVTSVYTVSGTSSLTGCANTSTLSQEVVICAGLNQITNSEKSILVYPNPASNWLNIICTSDAGFVLYDITGKLVQSEQLTSGGNKISLENVSKGIYLIVLKGNEGVTQRKLIVE